MPKTGGMWVSRFLKKLDSSFKRPKHLVKYNKHGFRELTDFHLPSKLVGPEYYKFGFIRNPVSWYWSMFNFQQKRSMRNENALFDIMISGRDINEYMQNVQKFDRARVRMMNMYNQVFSIGDKLECKNIFKYENLYDGLFEALKENGIDASELIEQEKENKINSSSSFEWPEMTKESLEFIYESCKEIYDKFEYERKK